MNHLATVERSRPGWPDSDRVASNEFDGSDTVTKVLQSNPLFEAFGNAKTLRNDNSSRFGKFTQLQFDVENSAAAQQNGRGIPSCHLAGSTCITYLLEKSRVVCAAEGEQTFHIFYQLLGAPEEEKRVIWEEGFIGASTSNFVYLNQTSPEEIDGLATPENWPITVAALSIFGLQGNAFINVARSLSVVLQLGNIVFDALIQNGTERLVISSREELEKLSSLLGVPAAEIETAWTTRLMITRGEEFTIFLKPNEAKDGCDALAKEVGVSAAQPLGVQREYVKAIQQRLQYEVKDNDKLVDSWLLNLLDENDWWVRKCHVPKVLKKLKMNAHPLAYYRDVYVWLPDVRNWKSTGGTCMPSCPNCKSSERVGPHAFRDNHFGRVVVDLTETYYVLGRRYICLECKNKSHQLKAALQETAAANNITIGEVRADEIQNTFMGWNIKSLPRFPCGIGNPSSSNMESGFGQKSG